VRAHLLERGLSDAEPFVKIAVERAVGGVDFLECRLQVLRSGGEQRPAGLPRQREEIATLRIQTAATVRPLCEDSFKVERRFGEAEILKHDLAADAQAAEHQRSREARAILTRDAGKDERQIAAGVPVPTIDRQQTGAPMATPTPTASSTSTGGVGVQVGAYSTRDQAEAGWSQLAGRYDALVAMYHDQGLIPVKLVDFDESVNVTLGLPIVRTSPDHGTAYDIAGKGIARPVSMQRALALAVEMVARRAAYRD
jgi:hypothetical protein